MGNVIEFLARLGEDASLRHASDEALADLISEAGMSEAVTALHAAVGHNIYFSGQMPSPQREVEEPEEEEEEDDEDEDDEDGEKPPRRSPRLPVPGSRH
jgi:TATA-binding protein-associated factor Taf7